MKKILIALVAATTIGVTALATSSTADARYGYGWGRAGWGYGGWGYGGWGRGGWGYGGWGYGGYGYGGFAAGAVIGGALAASPYYTFGLLSLPTATHPDTLPLTDMLRSITGTLPSITDTHRATNGGCGC